MADKVTNPAAPLFNQLCTEINDLAFKVHPTNNATPLSALTSVRVLHNVEFMDGSTSDMPPSNTIAISAHEEREVLFSDDWRRLLTQHLQCSNNLDNNSNVAADVAANVFGNLIKGQQGGHLQDTSLSFTVANVGIDGKKFKAAMKEYIGMERAAGAMDEMDRIIKHSAAVLLSSPLSYNAWNQRKRAVAQCKSSRSSFDTTISTLIQELLLTSLIAARKFKGPDCFIHRQQVIDTLMPTLFNSVIGHTPDSNASAASSSTNYVDFAVDIIQWVRFEHIFINNCCRKHHRNYAAWQYRLSFMKWVLRFIVTALRPAAGTSFANILLLILLRTDIDSCLGFQRQQLSEHSSMEHVVSILLFALHPSSDEQIGELLSGDLKLSIARIVLPQLLAFNQFYLLHHTPLQARVATGRFLSHEGFYVTRRSLIHLCITTAVGGWIADVESSSAGIPSPSVRYICGGWSAEDEIALTETQIELLLLINESQTTTAVAASRKDLLSTCDHMDFHLVYCMNYHRWLLRFLQ